MMKYLSGIMVAILMGGLLVASPGAAQGGIWITPDNATASSYVLLSVPGHAIDGTTATSWVANNEDAWLQVEMTPALLIGGARRWGSNENSNRCTLIEVSVDGVIWDTVSAAPTPFGSTENWAEDTWSPRDIRYIRFQMRRGAPLPTRPFLYEVQSLYFPPTPTPAPTATPRPITASAPDMRLAEAWGYTWGLFNLLPWWLWLVFVLLLWALALVWRNRAGRGNR